MKKLIFKVKERNHWINRFKKQKNNLNLFKMNCK